MYMYLMYYLMYMHVSTDTNGQFTLIKPTRSVHLACPCRLLEDFLRELVAIKLGLGAYERAIFL